MKDEVISLLKSEGYRVYMRPDGKTWAYYTNADGTKIAYAQWGRSGMDHRISTVHVPNRTTGTGFSYSDEITRDALHDALHCHAPAWASRNDAASVRKFSNWDAFKRSCLFGSEYEEV